MDDQPGLSEQYRMSSPWPLFVALGVAISEVGIILGFLPVAAGGLVLLAGSVTGILRESGYIGNPWRGLVTFATVLLGLGVGIYWYAASSAGVAAPLATDNVLAVLRNGNASVAYRGISIFVAGVLTYALAAAGYAAVSSAEPSAGP